MPAKSPLAIVKERFQSKENLVNAIRELATPELWIDRLNPQKGLARVSNRKLLRLHAILSEVKNRFGSRAKLIEAILEAEGRTKDAGRKAKLEKWPTPRLLDALKAAQKRIRNAERKARRQAFLAERRKLKQAAAQSQPSS
ncbi:MAG: hypothetical protein N2515_08055 [Deltaproteobacteria bacterium]|nr:hypothetical protein [Deltaproteobacteria bacterium]